jgi:hypothetical protein
MHTPFQLPISEVDPIGLEGEGFVVCAELSFVFPINFVVERDKNYSHRFQMSTIFFKFGQKPNLVTHLSVNPVF